MLAVAKDLRLSPPTFRNTIADYDDTERRIRRDGHERHLLDKSDDCYKKRLKRILLFLYGRRYFETDDAKRQASLAILLDATKRPIQRMHRLVYTNCPDEIQQTIQMKCWMQHVQAFGRSDDNSVRCVNVLAGNDSKSSSSIRMVRSIRSMVCHCLHASAVMQCYLVQQQQQQQQQSASDGNGGKGSKDNFPWVNISDYMRQHFGDQDLHDLVVDGVCHDHHLQDLLDDPAELVVYSSEQVAGLLAADGDDKPCQLEQLLMTHGPALVSGMRMEQRWHDYQQPLVCQLSGDYELPVFTGTNSKDVPWNCSLVLVGMKRRCSAKNGNDHDNNDTRLLCQYWTDDMQFVELSQEYFLTSAPVSLAFAGRPQLKIPDQFLLVVPEHDDDDDDE